jgi:hypothetical protein
LADFEKALELGLLAVIFSEIMRDFGSNSGLSKFMELFYTFTVLYKKLNTYGNKYPNVET